MNGKSSSENDRQGRVSQQRIARELGVSQALVSMVLNGRSKGIARETYRRIWDYAVGVGYRPKGMRMRGEGSSPRRSLVGFILRSRLTLYTQSNFFSHVQHGLHAFLEERGLSSFFLGTENTLAEKGWESLNPMREQLHGVVVMGQVDLGFLRGLRRLFPRVVTVSASYPGTCHSVLNNESQAADLLVSHLVELGHRSFAWIGLCEHKKRERHRQRLAAFRDAVDRHGVTCRPESEALVDGGDRMEGRSAARQLLEKFERERMPTAWVAYNGLMARGAANFLLSRQVSVPGEVSLAAIDGTRVCDEEEPTLTGAFTDPEEMGAMAGRILLEATGTPDEVFTDVVLPALLTPRGSTAAASAEFQTVR